MLWQGRRESDNVDDRRGITGGHVAVGGGILGVIALIVNFFLVAMGIIANCRFPINPACICRGTGRAGY